MECSSRTWTFIWLQKQQKDDSKWKNVEVLIPEDRRRQTGHEYIGIQVNHDP